MPLEGSEYVLTATGSVLKPVHCERCGAHYIYKMFRQAAGSGSSLLEPNAHGARQRASSRAQESVRKMLREGFDAVPCPRCGVYQSQMTRRLKDEHHGWLRGLGIFLVLFGLLGAWLSLYGTGPYGLHVWPVGLAMILGRRWLASRFDPNAASHERAGHPRPDVALVSPGEYQGAVEAQRVAA